MRTLFISIFYLMIVTAGLSFVTSLFKKNKLLLPISILMLASFTFDFTTEVSYEFFNTYLVYNGAIYRIIEFMLLSEFYYLILRRRRSRTVYIVKTIIQILLCLTLVILIPLNATPLRILNSVIYSSVALLYFSLLIRNMSVTKPLDYPVFWINSGILIYFSGALFLFLVFEPLANIHTISAVTSYIFHNFLGIVKNILIGVGFWKAMKNPEWETKMVNLNNH